MTLPITWTLAQLGDLTTQIVGGGTPSKASSANFDGHIPFMTVKDMKARFVSTTVDHISDQALNSSSTVKVPADTLIVASRMSLGKIARPTMDVAINQDLKAIFLQEGIEKTYLEYFWRSKSHAIQAMGTGTTVKGIRLEDIRALNVPLAPRDEQKRIADKLDTVLTRVDAVNARLARVAPLLKRFRQSVLTAATSGRLTEDWRGSVSPHWDTMCAEEVCSKVQSGGTPKAGFADEGVPFLKVYNIVDQKVSFDYKPQFVSHEIHRSELRKSQVEPGDVLMNIVGPPLGKVAIVPDSHASWNINQAITLFRPSDRVCSRWIYIILCEGAPIREVLSKTKGSVGQVNISLSQCRAFELPVPPADEQAEIVRRVETLFAFADRLEARLQAAQTATERLTPSLLAKAFRGELVPQDPNDEPASELLKRLTAVTAPATAKRRGRVAKTE